MAPPPLSAAQCGARAKRSIEGVLGVDSISRLLRFAIDWRRFQLTLQSSNCMLVALCFPFSILVLATFNDALKFLSISLLAFSSTRYAI